MRLLRLLIAALAFSLLACVPAAVASSTGEVLTVSATSSNPVLSEDLNPSHTYRIAVSGVIGAHKGQTAEYDALYCFGPCKPPQAAAALRAAQSGQGLTSGVGLLPGAEKQLAYSGAHTYSVDVYGVEGQLAFGISDNDYTDNSGAFRVTITDLGIKRWVFAFQMRGEAVSGARGLPPDYATTSGTGSGIATFSPDKGSVISSGGTLRFTHEFVGILTKDAEITITTSRDRAAFQVLNTANGTVVQLLGTVTKTTLKGCRVGSSAQIVLKHGKRGTADSVALKACGDQLLYRHSPKDLSKVVVQIK